MGGLREGPRVRIEASCFGCRFEQADHYAVQGDSGTDISCTHPEVTGDRTIGDTNWTTPAWCPLLPIAVETLIAGHKAKGEKI